MASLALDCLLASRKSKTPDLTNPSACMGAPILITEIAFPTHRGPVTSMFNTGWGFGSIIAAWTTYGTFRIKNN